MSAETIIIKFLTVGLFASAFQHFLRPKCSPTLKKIASVSNFHLEMATSNRGYTTVFIVPTGVGAAIGGYAGDALPSARLIASVSDTFITHPNVANGAMMYWPIHNMLYTEGFALDEFAGGRLALSPIRKKSQKIGLLLDKGMEEELRVRHLQVANAARATLGAEVLQCVITSRPIGVEIKISKSGASWGSIRDTKTLIEGAEKLLDLGCTAIAVVARFPEDDELDNDDDGNVENPDKKASFKDLFEQYRQGVGVDGIAGAEALISHVITKKLGVPCAHAPAFSPMEADNSVNPKACAEELGYTFLPCVLSYLRTAPDLVPINHREKEGNKEVKQFDSRFIYSQDVDAVVVPYNALGGPAVLAFAQGNNKRIIIAVLDNETAMKVDKTKLSSINSTTNTLNRTSIVLARSYAEAAGLLVAHKNGIMLESITPKVDFLPVTEL